MMQDLNIAIFICYSVLFAFLIRKWYLNNIAYKKQLEKIHNKYEELYLDALISKLKLERKEKEKLIKHERIKNLSIFIKTLNTYGASSPEIRKFWSDHTGDVQLAISCGTAISLLSVNNDVSLEQVLNKQNINQ